MLKASAGGGGKGMRIVHEAGELRRAYEGAAARRRPRSATTAC
jgi:biotin carboxylase